jgi:hypothetical protein
MGAAKRAPLGAKRGEYRAKLPELLRRGSLIWIKSRKGRLPAPFELLNLHTNRESCISKGDRKPPSPQTLAPALILLGLFLLFANEPELNLFVVHTNGEHGKRPAASRRPGQLKNWTPVSSSRTAPVRNWHLSIMRKNQVGAQPPSYSLARRCMSLASGRSGHHLNRWRTRRGTARRGKEQQDG